MRVNNIFMSDFFHMKIKEKKGFTLLELALILVIIGIIIGIILKGRDVVESSRLKRFESEVRHWRTSAWVYLDRKGTFPGDSDNNGIIGDEVSPTVPGSTVILNADLLNPPKANPITAGSLNFWLYWGNNGNTDIKKNVMVICVSNDCEETYEGDVSSGNMKYVEFIDAVVDGTADGTTGLVRAVSTKPELDPPSGDTNDRTVTKIDDTEGTPGWITGETRAMVYYIDNRLDN